MKKESKVSVSDDLLLKTFDVSDLDNGMYFVRIDCGKDIVSTKFIVSK